MKQTSVIDSTVIDRYGYRIWRFFDITDVENSLVLDYVFVRSCSVLKYIVEKAE